MAKQKPLLRTHSHSLTATAQTSEAVAASVSKGAVAGWLVPSAPAAGRGRRGRAAAHLPSSPAELTCRDGIVPPQGVALILQRRDF